MFSAFWELAYVQNFDGGSTFIPIVHPHTNMCHYAILGSVLSHGYMSSGFLPIRLAFPVLAYTLLGCDISIPDPLIIDSFIDYISTYESSVICEALKESKNHQNFDPQVKDSLTAILGSMGCRDLPTPKNIQQLLIEVARYEFAAKPLGALYSLRSGVPKEYHPFWTTFQCVSYTSYIKLLVPPMPLL